MYLDFSKSISKQLDKIYKEYKFKSSFDETFKTCLVFFFVNKLNHNEISFPEFCFHIKLNSSQSLQDISSVSFEFMERFYQEIMNSFNPNSFSSTKFKRTLTSSEIAFFNLGKLIIKSEEYKEKGLSFDKESIRYFFTSNEEKYAYSDARSKQNLFKNEFFEDFLFVPEMSNEEIFIQRKLIFSERFFNSFLVTVAKEFVPFLNQTNILEFGVSSKETLDDINYIRIVFKRCEEEYPVVLHISNVNRIINLIQAIELKKRILNKLAEFLNLN